MIRAATESAAFQAALKPARMPAFPRGSTRAASRIYREGRLPGGRGAGTDAGVPTDSGRIRLCVERTS